MVELVTARVTVSSVIPEYIHASRPVSDCVYDIVPEIVIHGFSIMVFANLVE
jgi:hypothetical protein